MVVRGHFGREKNSYKYLTYTIKKITLSMAFICHDCCLWICACANFAHAFLCRCFNNTVLLKQSAYRNRELFLGRYCDVSLYKCTCKFRLTFPRRCFDNTVLLKHSAYRNRGLFLSRYCDVLSYNHGPWFYHRHIKYLINRCFYCNQKEGFL